MKLELTEAPLLWFRVFHSDRATEAPRCSSLKVADEQGKEVSRASSCEDFFFSEMTDILRLVSEADRRTSPLLSQLSENGRDNCCLFVFFLTMTAG